MKKRLLPLLAAAFTSTLFAAGELGDPAASLQIADWVKGKPVDLAAGKGKQVYVVEFWATWCGPCRASIPHLTELQKKFKDVTFIGVSDEELATVKKFVEKMGDKMDYTVAVDKDRKTSEGYMGAYGINGIPHAFIVDKAGSVVWNGHPMADLEEALKEVVAGKFNLEKAKKRAAAQAKVEEFYEAAAKGDDAKMEKLAKEIETLDKELDGITPGQKFDAAEIKQRAQFQGALREYQMALARGNSDADLAALEKKLEATAPKEFKLADFKEAMTLNKVFSEYYRAASGRGDKEQLPELAKKLTEAKTKNAEALNQWAWVILTDERIKTRDLELATTLAKRAVECSESKNAGVLDTYARALADSGKTSEAIEWQKKAVAASEDEDMKKELGDTLKQYEKKLAKK